MSTRQQKVNSLLQREISEYLLEEGFEGIAGIVTITGADASPDLEHAKIFFSVVGQETEAVLAILKQHIYEIQGMLNRKMAMREVPRIVFVPDPSGAYAQHISQLIHRLHGQD